MKRGIAVLALGLVFSGLAAAQRPGPPPPQAAPGRGQTGNALHMPPGRWWDDPNTAQHINLTADQQHRMDDIFDGARARLIDLEAAVQKAETGLDPLLAADAVDRAAVQSQLERIYSARDDLARADSDMLLNLRLVLSRDQWQKLQAERPPGR